MAADRERLGGELAILDVQHQPVFAVWAHEERIEVVDVHLGLEQRGEDPGEAGAALVAAGAARVLARTEDLEELLP